MSMFEVRKDIAQALTNDTQVTDLLGQNKVFAGIVPTGTSFPYLYYTTSLSARSPTHDQNLNSQIRADQIVLEIAVCSLSSDLAWQIAEQIDIALDRRNSDSISVILLESINEGVAPQNDDSTNVVTVLQMTFNVRRKAKTR